MTTRTGSVWVDPAPLEVSRPRLPWWTLLPRWVKVVLFPVFLACILSWVGYQLGRIAGRYPLTLGTALLAGWVDLRLGHWGLGYVALGVVVSLVAWWWLRRPSFRRVALPQARTEFRRFSVYACQWRMVMRLSELTKDKRGKEYRPKLGRVRSDGWRDRVRVRMVKGQAPEQWELRASGLAHSFNANSCLVRVLKPGRLELDFVHGDPLARPIPVPGLAVDESKVDLKRVPIGRTENGWPWRLRLLGTHVLTVGVSGAGKGSLLWAVVWALAPLIRSGAVRLVGIDPKGGMELGQAPEVFHRVVFDNGLAVELLANGRARPSSTTRPTGKPSSGRHSRPWASRDQNRTRPGCCGARSSPTTHGCHLGHTWSFERSRNGSRGRPNTTGPCWPLQEGPPGVQETSAIPEAA
jgi:S-DNA-T family DNA segregation ATPase FtsK/SpoIIIE